MFLEWDFDDNWRTVDSKDMKQLDFISGDKETLLVEPQKGTVIKRDDGIAIYMGDLTYMIGDMHMLGA